MSQTITTATVFLVWDGDSFVCWPNLRVRLANVNAPERWMPGYDLATQRLTNLIQGREVLILPVATDSYGRTVADVYVGTIHVNAAMRGYGYR